MTAVEVVSPPAASSGTDAASPVEESSDGAAALVAAQLEGREKQLTLEVGPHRLPVTSLDKVLWPGKGEAPPVTKRDLLRYLSAASGPMLAHLRDRPLTLIRFPEGIDGERFYQKHWEKGRPDFVETVSVYSDHNGGDEQLVMVNNLASLLWLGQVAALEVHAWYARIDPRPEGAPWPTEFGGSLEAVRRSLLNYPDYIAFDMDPVRPDGASAPRFERGRFLSVCEAAVWLREVLDSLSLSSFVKTTGRSGLHVFVPLERTLDYDAVRAISQTIANFLKAQHPREIALEWAVNKRAGDVFVDTNQNVRGKTLVAAYSSRATAEATVSMPLRWDEVGRVMPTDFTIWSAPNRLSERGDSWSGFLDAKGDLAARLGMAGGPGSAQSV